jgi:tetraacyldisaccharide 4'-kinase
MSPEDVWYGGHWLAYPLLPASWLYRSLIWARRLAYRRGWVERCRLPVPVIIVGNLTVGGTGKTPFVIWLCGFLRRRGMHPGVILRGYGGDAGDWPRMIGPDGDPFQVGDEALVLARRTGCPVAAGPDRAAAARRLLREAKCNIIVADDGLQHYRLERNVEILVVDGVRGYGNGHCLPAGPLREPVSRARGIGLKVCTGQPCAGGEFMRLLPGRLVNLREPERTRDLAGLNRQRVTAVAGIGNPARFFDLLRGYGLHLDERAYRDHHRFTPDEVASWPPGPVVMTEKDAVKCRRFAGPDHWYLPVEAELSPAFEGRLSRTIEGLVDG